MLELGQLKIEWDKKMEFEMSPSDKIDEAGIKDIANLFTNYLNINRIEKLVNETEWVWLVTKGKYTGTLPKRIMKYIYNEFNVKLDSWDQAYISSNIGNIVRQYTVSGTKYTFDFNKSLKWNDGEFADGGSCYFARSAVARDMLRQNNAFAIRFYSTPDSGAGRSWVCPVLDPPCYVIYNTYGSPSLVNTARILATISGFSYKRVDVENNNDTDRGLWINSGYGYVIGSEDIISKYSLIDLNYEELYRCEYCEELFTENDMNRYHEYCLSCYESRVYKLGG